MTQTIFPCAPRRRNRHPWSVRPILGVLTAALALSLPAAAQAQQLVTVTINRFVQGQDPDPAPGADSLSHADLRGDGDYYAQVRIGDAPFQRNRGDFHEGSDFRPFWQFSQVVDQPGTIPVVIRIWDADLIENNDDIIDLNGNDNAQELVLTLEPETCTWDGDAGPNGMTSSGDGDREHFGALEGGERGHIFFDVACSDGDFDDDGIPDGIERFGIFDRVNDTWQRVDDLATMGADPCRKTILVEIDAVLGALPTPGAANILRDAFDQGAVPVPNGDCPYPDFAPAKGGVDLVLDFSDVQLPPTAVDGNGNYQMDDVDFYKRTAFDPAREPYFHYALWAPSVTPTPGRCCSGLRGTDFIGQPLGSATLDAVLFMHELGHALGLSHSGAHDIDRDVDGNPVSRNCKPNYQSIMNYIWGAGIIDTATGDVVVDYSRETLQTLDESALNEQVPLDDGTLETCWSPFLGTRMCGPANAPINWNGTTTGGATPMDVFDPGTVAADINGFAILECGREWNDDNGDGQIQLTELDLLSTPGDTLAGFDDWANLRFRAPLAEPSGFGPAHIHERKEAEIFALDAALQARLRCNPPDSGPWLIARNCTIWRDVTAPDDVRVPAGVVLTIGDGVHLDVDLVDHALRVDPGGRLEITPGSRVD
ncbi:MAG: hypothetical protein AAF376_02355 [Pseudomonadota bacterium]